MKITCHSCAAKYTVSDEKVQGKTVKMKCRKCGATIVVGGAQHADASPQDEATVAAGGPGDGGADLAAGSFLVNVNDGDQRTMTLAEVVDAYQTGVVNADTYVWADGMTDWQPISDNAAISAALGGGGAANGNGNGGYAAPAPEPLAAAAQPAREEPRPAARRDSNRRSGDLFSGGGMSDGGLSSSLSSSASGKRDENSVLFSLSALTSTAAAPAKSSAGATTATKEDSGLIDLKALAAAPAPAAATAPMLETVGLFPLGAPVLAPPPVAAPVSIPAEAPKAKSNMTMVLILGILAVAGISTAVFFAVKSGGGAPTATVAANPTPTEPTPAQTTPPTQPTTPSTTPTAPATDATPPASGATSGTPATPNTPNTPNKPNTPPNQKPTTTAPTTSPTPKPTTTTPKPTACPCPPGDLMCAMQKCAGKK